MFITKKRVNDNLEIYIETDPCGSVDVIADNGISKTSIQNYGTYYDLDLFEHNDHLFIIRRSHRDTMIIPLHVRDDNTVVTGFYLHNTYNLRLNNKDVERVFNVENFN